MKKRLSVLFFTLFAASLILYSAHVYAQQANEGINLTVSPTFFDLTNAPDSTIHGKFRVRNNTSQAVSLLIRVDKLTANPDGRIIPVKAQASDTYLSWLSFDQTSIDAKPQEWTDVNYTLAIPQDAAFGYYYAIHIGQNPQAIKGNPTAKLLGEVVIPVLLDVKKDGTVKQARLVEFKPTLTTNEFLPVDFSITMQNTGNVHIKPTGNIFIRGPREKDLAVLEVNPGFGAILPNAKRTFTSSWDDGFIVREPVLEDGAPKVDKNGNPETHLVINWNKLTSFRIGKYTANLLMVYDNGTRDVPIEASKTFWVLPYTAIAVFIVSVVIIFLIIRFLLTWYIKGQIKKYQKS